MTYDIIGTIYKPSGIILTDVGGNEYPEMVPLDGYHVNILPQEDMSLVSPFIIAPSSPSRVFAGRDDTVALKFANRDEWLSVGIEVLA